MISIEYELDQWEWQGTTRSVEVDPEDFTGMSADEIGQAVYAEVRRDAVQNLHLVYGQGQVTQEVLDALQNSESEGDDDDDND